MPYRITGVDSSLIAVGSRGPLQRPRWRSRRAVYGALPRAPDQGSIAPLAASRLTPRTPGATGSGTQDWPLGAWCVPTTLSFRSRSTLQGRRERRSEAPTAQRLMAMRAEVVEPRQQFGMNMAQSATRMRNGDHETKTTTSFATDGKQRGNGGRQKQRPGLWLPIARKCWILQANPTPFVVHSVPNLTYTTIRDKRPEFGNYNAG